MGQRDWDADIKAAEGLRFQFEQNAAYALHLAFRAEQAAKGERDIANKAVAALSMARRYLEELERQAHIAKSVAP